MSTQQTIKNVLFFMIFICFMNCSFGNDLLDVEQISKTQYFSKLTSLIKKAEKKIFIVLSSFTLRSCDKDDPFFIMVRSLVLSHLEGVDVTIILNPELNVFFGEENRNIKNEGYNLLKSSKVPIFYLKDENRINYNLMIIDSNIVVQSTQPWDASSTYQNNFYSNFLIKSEKLAKSKYLEIISSNVILTDIKSTLVDQAVKTVKLNNYFLQQKQCRKILKSNKMILLDLHMVLLLKNHRKSESRFKISIQRITSQIFSKVMTKIEAKKKIIYYLKILKKFKIIEINFKDKKNPEIKISSLAKPGKVKIPVNYFNFKLARRLTLKEKVIYFLLCDEFSQSKNRVYVKFDLEKISKKTKIDIKNVKRILLQLEKKLLIDIVPSKENDETIRCYTICEPRNMKVLDKSLDILKQQLGSKLISKAQLLASKLNKEFDPEVIRETAYYLKELGLLDTQKIFQFISNLEMSDNKRSFIEVKKHLVETLNNKLQQQY